MMKNFTLFTAFLAVILTSQAQTTHPAKSSSVFFGINFDLGIPINEFKTYNDEVAVGGGFNLFFQPSNKIPVLVGFDLAFMNNGFKTEDKTLTADIVVDDVVIDQLLFPMRIETSNTISTGHLNLRFQSPTKFFKPYLDGIIGFNNFSTTTSIYDESEEYYLSEEDNPLITSSKQNSDWTFSYGGAAGLMIELSETILIDLRVAYSLGGNASYFVEDDIDEWEVVFNTIPTTQEDVDEEDISIAATPKESETDMILGTIGLTFRF